MVAAERVLPPSLPELSAAFAARKSAWRATAKDWKDRIVNYDDENVYKKEKKKGDATSLL
jgi:hypothetical protein